MTQTHTSQWYDVSNGGTVSYTVPSERTLQSNVEIRFRGEEKQTSNTSRRTKENVSSVSDNLSPGERMSASSTYPSPPSDASDVNYDGLYAEGANSIGINNTGISFKIEYGTGDKTGSQHFAEGEANDGLTADAGNVSSGDKTMGTFENTDNESKTIEFYVSARVWYDKTETTTEQTQSPSVTLDSDTASYSGTVGNNELTNWSTLNTFAEGKNNFSFSIDGSNVADFRFRYDYKAAPTPIGYLAIGQQDGTRTLLPLADPNDSALVYNDERVLLSDGTIAAEDLVDPSDPDATNVRVVRSDGSIAAWRRDNFGGSP